ncbi:MAG: response regulator transcription factor [Clostridiaceae bacterium]|nr:response regulator transcription factor [Clostridiaceae bacterium]
MSEECVKVLVVEDEVHIRKFININLTRNGFEVVEAESGEEAMEKLRTFKPGMIVLDIMLPGMDGFDVCRKVRYKMPEVPVIMLTAKGQDVDKIVGLELGADDYMVKPFNPLELVARMRAVLRRSGRSKEERTDILKFESLELDLKAQKFLKKGNFIELTPKEFAVMKTFMENQDKAFTRDELMDIVWGSRYYGDIKTVDVHIRRLREKIEDDPSNPCFIETVWGHGYRLGKV